MIDLYYWTTPNGHKITIFLEEAALAYQIVPVNISQGDQGDCSRQRYLPEYRALRENAAGFLDLCFDAKRAAEMQPIRRFQLPPTRSR